MFLERYLLKKQSNENLLCKWINKCIFLHHQSRSVYALNMQWAINNYILYFPFSVDAVSVVAVKIIWNVKRRTHLITRPNVSNGNFHAIKSVAENLSELYYRLSVVFMLCLKMSRWKPFKVSVIRSELWRKITNYEFQYIYFPFHSFIGGFYYAHHQSNSASNVFPNEWKRRKWDYGWWFSLPLKWFHQQYLCSWFKFIY